MTEDEKEALGLRLIAAFLGTGPEDPKTEKDWQGHKDWRPHRIPEGWDRMVEVVAKEIDRLERQNADLVKAYVEELRQKDEEIAFLKAKVKD